MSPSQNSLSLYFDCFCFQPVIRIYDIPDNTFSSDEDEEDDDTSDEDGDGE